MAFNKLIHSLMVNRRRNLGVVLGTFGLCAGLALTAAEAQDLKETLELTYATNPSLKAQRAVLRATDELAAQARAGGRPTLNGSLKYETNDGSYDPGAGFSAGGGDPAAAGILSSLSGSGVDSTNTAGVELRIPLFQGFRTLNSIREADARIDVARADLVETEQQVFAEAIAAYFSVITNSESVRASEVTLRSLDRQRQAAQARFEVGQSTLTDIAQAKARLAGANSQLIRARSDLAASRKQFERVVGQMPMELVTQPPIPVLPAVLDEALSIAENANPTLKAARARLNAAEHQLNVAKGFLSPTLQAVANYGQVENQFLDGDEVEQLTIGAELVVPLYQGGATYSSIRQAKEAVKAERFALMETRRRVAEQVQVAWERVGASKAAYEASQATVEASTLALEGLVLESDVGQRTTLDVLDGERELLNAQLTSFQAQEQYYLTVFSLLQVMGGLTAETLSLDVKQYDPQLNKRRVQRKWIGAGSYKE